MEPQTAATVGHLVQDPKIWGETYAFWCQTAVLAVAALFALIAIISARRIERKKTALALIFDSKSDDKLTDAIRLIAALHDAETSMATFAKKAKIDSDESKSIRYALNHFESVAVGIFHGTFDEGTFKSSQYTTVTRLYDRTKPYIDTIRKEHGGSPTNYQEFECLACRWAQNPLEKKTIASVQVGSVMRSIKNFLGF
jgi:hypothetical protein